MTTDIYDDLAKSGLTHDIMQIRELSLTEIASAKIVGLSRDTVGYVIPYFDIFGDTKQFYRIKILGDTKRKYTQLPGTRNHIYFPPRLPGLLSRLETDSSLEFIIVTEGEKKAAASVEAGFPCVAVTGVDSWISKTIILPGKTELESISGGRYIKAKIPSGLELSVSDVGTVAEGLVDVVDLVVSKNLDVIICYDTDDGEIKLQVQKSAARLGYEFRYRGVPANHIRQLILPGTQHNKVGLDDYLIENGAKGLAPLIRSCRSKRIAFPRHPNPKAVISNRLQPGRVSRRDAQEIGLTILIELDTRGRRIKTIDTNELHYFDEDTYTLMRVDLIKPKMCLHESKFGSFLYEAFNLGQADAKIVQWLATQYTGEPTVYQTKTSKVITLQGSNNENIAYQISDTSFVIISGDEKAPFKICNNGDFGILFEQGKVEPIDSSELEIAFYEDVDKEVPDMHWFDVLNQLNFKQYSSESSESGNTSNEIKLLASLLFYISPWLYRWKMTQLPIEIVIGEPSSGKSSLYSLRQSILTGTAKLSNITNDIRDWYAGIVNTGGTYVMDNVRFTSITKDFQQRLSDELCRLTTEPSPHVEMRKLYTTSESSSISVDCTFALTSIEQPFYSSDLIQRSAIFELEAIGHIHDSYWAQRQLDKLGGRTGWIAHHLSIIHRFLNLATHTNKGGIWDKNHKTTHRLANYEQCLEIMAKVFGLDCGWIPTALRSVTTDKISESDWALQGIIDFVKETRMKVRKKDLISMRFSAADITQWAEKNESYYKNSTLTNNWKLGRYLRSHKMDINRASGLVESGKFNNKRVYLIELGDIEL